jgi:hypothetical protein
VKKLTAPFLVLAVLAVILAGCGGGGSKSGSSSGSGSSGSGNPVNGVKVGECLNTNDDFLVQPSTDVVTGQSPAGVSFSMKFYATPAAARAAAAKKSKKTTAVVENAVIDFKGNPSPYAGAPPAKISKTELDDIKSCIDSSK